MFVDIIFKEKRLDMSCKSSAQQTIYTKCQVFFSLEKFKKVSFAALVINSLWVNKLTC